MPAAPAFDPLLDGIATLRSPERRPIITLLSREDGLPAPLVPHAIPLLAVDPLADYALFALRKVAEVQEVKVEDLFSYGAFPAAPAAAAPKTGASTPASSSIRTCPSSASRGA